MEQLTNALKVALATDFIFYMKAHNFHLNAVGPNFSEFHEFFGEIYEETWGWSDELAEEIRTLDTVTPFSCARFAELSMIQEEVLFPPTSCMEMVQELHKDNMLLIEALYAAHRAATEQSNFGISSHLEAMITASQKRGWMLKAYLQ